MIILKLFYFFLPVCLANMAPVLLQHKFNFLAQPIDQGKKWRGREIFGSHKTWRGIIVATISGGLLYVGQYLLAMSNPIFNNLPFNYLSAPIWFGFIISLAAILGDLMKSFFKRQFNIAAGKSWIPFDQWDFLITSTAVLYWYFFVPYYFWLLILGFGLFLHMAINRVGFWLKIKNTPW